MIQVDQGYSVLPGVFEPVEMARVAETLAVETVQRTKAGARHVLHLPVVRDLAADPRMLDIARQYVGAAAVPFRATLFDKVSDGQLAGCLAPGHGPADARAD